MQFLAEITATLIAVPSLRQAAAEITVIEALNGGYNRHRRSELLLASSAHTIGFTLIA